VGGQFLSLLICGKADWWDVTSDLLSSQSRAQSGAPLRAPPANTSRVLSLAGGHQVSSAVGDSLLTHLRVLAYPGLGSCRCFYRRGMSLEFDGKTWEPRPGATVTAEELTAARSFIHEMHQQALWSPWVFLECADEYDAAWEICGQWTSSEPAPPPKTLEELEAGLEQRLADADAQFLAREEQAESDRAERAKHYDPGRTQAQLALLEEQGILADKIRQRDELLALDLSQLPAKAPRAVGWRR
jgi:hypothetical protein